VHRLITSRAEIASWLPRRAEFPDEYVMDHNGQFIRECFTQIKQVELNYGSPRAFDYFMTRLSGEEWENEQNQEKGFGAPITLKTIEGVAVSTPIEDMMRNEFRRFDSSRMLDMDLCMLIDEKYLPLYGVTSVYQLAEEQKEWIAREIKKSGCRVTESNLRRCLVM
jgi:hypothetical protein